MIVMPASEPRTPPQPRSFVPIDARQRVADTLTDIAVRLDTRPEPVESLYKFWQPRCGGLIGCVIIALIAAAYADSEQTAALLDDLAVAATRLDRHRAVNGHDECCGGNCPCAQWPATARVRCRECEDGPTDNLWAAQADLLCDLERLHSLPHLLRAAQDTT